jgi:hypothetical protein
MLYAKLFRNAAIKLMISLKCLKRQRKTLNILEDPAHAVDLSALVEAPTSAADLVPAVAEVASHCYNKSLVLSSDFFSYLCSPGAR